MKEKHRILLKRLDRPEYQTGETLADFMGISSKTVRLLIREINEELEGAAIVSRRRVGYRLEISDRDRFERFIGKTRDRQLPATPQERIAYILEVLLKERQFIKLDDLSERLYISKKTLSRELKEVEARLTAYGLRLVRRPGYGIAAEENDNIVIDSSTSGLAVRMLELVKSAFSYDFLEDLELRMALCQHLLPLKVRMGCGLSMKNPLLKEIREKYPLAYAMAAHATIAVEQEYGGRMADDEIGYIALLFALALERRRTEIAKKNILLVCASGHGTAELMKYKYRQEFGRYLQHVETCDVNQLETINFDCFDYVFTTVPIRIPVPIPIEEVGSFLEEGEIRRIRKMLGPKQRRRIRGYYPEALFFPGLEADAKEEALRRMCARMTEVCGLAPMSRCANGSGWRRPRLAIW